jgi:DNA-binding NarL/FixJ family response regulator
MALQLVMPRGRDLAPAERSRIKELQRRSLEADQAARRALKERDAALAELQAAGVSVVRVSNVLDLSEEAIRVAIKRAKRANERKEVH